MHCPNCKSEVTHIIHCGDPRSQIEIALNVLGRSRKCDNGCKPFKTYELDAAELSDLRRRAHLFERNVGSATRA